MSRKRWAPERIESFLKDWHAGLAASALREKYGVRHPSATAGHFRELGFPVGYRHIQARTTRARWLARHARQQRQYTMRPVVTDEEQIAVDAMADALRRAIKRRRE